VDSVLIFPLLPGSRPIDWNW